MFDILVYLYETYYRPEACPDTAVLAKKLSAVGFEEDEISEALDWLNGLTEMAQECADQPLQQTVFTDSIRVFVRQEIDALGTAAIGLIQFLEGAKVINATQREIVIERALAVDESPI